MASKTFAQRVNLVEQIERERYALCVHLEIMGQSLRGDGATQARTTEPPFLIPRALRLKGAFLDPSNEIRT